MHTFNDKGNRSPLGFVLRETAGVARAFLEGVIAIKRAADKDVLA